MLDSRWKAVLVVYVALLGGVPEARAEEWLNFYTFTGEMSLGFEGRWKETDSGQSTWQTEYEESLLLRLGGYSLNPRILHSTSIWNRR